MEDRREIGPTFFFAPPRVFENLLTQIMVRMEDAGWLKRRMFHYFLGVARRCGEQILNGKPVPLHGRLLYWLGDLLVYAPLKNLLGLLAHARRLHRGRGDRAGAVLVLPLARHQPEAALRADRGQRLHHRAARRRGLFRHRRQPALPNVDQSIADSGEVLFKTPGVFLSYFKNDAKTARDQDAGRLGARPATPASSTSAGISRSSTAPRMSAASTTARCSRRSTSRTAQVLSRGCARRWPSATAATTSRCSSTSISTSVGNWAERNNVSYASYQELAGHPQVYDIVAKRSTSSTRRSPRRRRWRPRRSAAS